MTVIATNTAALRASNASAAATKALGTAMERLSTGQRINSAKDDAAGLAISSQMTSQIRGMQQGIRNANDGISYAQTAEGSLNEVTNMLQRMRELTNQGLNGTNNTTAKANIQKELEQLSAQIADTLKNTEFNGKKLFASDVEIDESLTDAVTTAQAGVTAAQDAIDALDDQDADYATDLAAAQADLATAQGALTTAQAAVTAAQEAAGGGDISILAGANASDAISIKQNGLASNAALAKIVDIANGKSAYALNAAETGGGEDGTDPIEAATSDILADFDDALAAIASTRADLGAVQNRLESAVNNMTNNIANMSDARSRIQDTDFSAESTALAKQQILSQASTAMLAQANQSQQNVLSLLR